MPIQQATYAVPRADLGEAIHEFNVSDVGLIADDVLPIMQVQKKAATMSVVTRENMKRVDTKHANGAAYNRVTTQTEDLAYACEERGLEEQLTDQDRSNYANDYDPEYETSMLCYRRLLIEREVAVAAMIFNTTTWTGASLYTDYSGAPWDTAASDAIAQVGVAKEYVRTNGAGIADTLIIGAKSLQNLLNMTVIKNRFPGAAVLTEAMIRSNIAAIFGLQNLIVGRSSYDSANEGQDFTGADVWSDDYAMICRRSTGSPKEGGLGKTLLWTDESPDIVNVDQYREEQTKSDIFRVRHYVDELIFDKYCGYLIKIDA